MTTEIAKLRWHCRRGMLELDLLLLPFLENIFPKLPPEEQAIFEKLLTCTDQDLYDWFINHAQPADPQIATIVTKVRNGA